MSDVPIDWPAASAAFAALHDDEGEAEWNRLTELWQAEYKAAFVAFALSRPGWTRENAETWCNEIVDDALLDNGFGILPNVAAKADVLECEWDTQNAC